MNKIVGRPKGSIKQFCPKGHDKFLTGKDSTGHCRVCMRVKNNSWRKKNLEKARQLTKNWHQRNPVSNKEKNWKSLRDSDGSQFTILSYDRLYQIQKGSCAICKIHQSALKKSLAVDHDHKTGVVRGLLCDLCNHGIGNFKDNTELLQSATQYLLNEKHDE